MENEKCAQPWMIQNTAISVDGDCRYCCQNAVHWGQCSPPPLILLALILICPWIGFMEVWQSFSTVWPEFLSPDSTPNRPSDTHLKEGSAQPYTWKWFQLITIFPLTKQTGGGFFKCGQQEHFSGVMCARLTRSEKVIWHISAKMNNFISST